MIASRRWQDWAATLIGAVVGLSPLVFTSTWTEPAAWTAYILGGLIFLVGAFSLVYSEATYFEGFQVILAVALFASPWLIGFTAITWMAWTAWVGGATLGLAVGSYYFLREQGTAVPTPS